MTEPSRKGKLHISAIKTEKPSHSHQAAMEGPEGARCLGWVWNQRVPDLREPLSAQLRGEQCLFSLSTFPSPCTISDKLPSSWGWQGGCSTQPKFWP